MSSKAIGVIWFSNIIGQVGIVLSERQHTETSTEYQAHISQVTGSDQDRDIKIIMEWGAKFPAAAAIHLIKKNGTWLTKNIFNS